MPFHAVQGSLVFQEIGAGQILWEKAESRTGPLFNEIQTGGRVHRLAHPRATPLEIWNYSGGSLLFRCGEASIAACDGLEDVNMPGGIWILISPKPSRPQPFKPPVGKEGPASRGKHFYFFPPDSLG